MNKKEYLNEESYQETEKKLLKLSKILLIVGICLSAMIIIVGVINTNKKLSDKAVIETVDYVADTKKEIEQLKTQLNEKQAKLTQEAEKLTAKKNELIAKGIRQSLDYNNGEAYDLYILDTVLNPGYNSCWVDTFSKNVLSKEFCSLRNDVEDLEDKIEAKEKYISSGRAESETKEKNERLEQEAEWNKSSDKLSIMPYIVFAIPAFMFPGMISLMLFTTAKRRSLMAFSAQQVMPVAQEGIEKMAPTIGKAGASIAKEMVPVYKDMVKEMSPMYGDIAKEISKGIKEGINEADEKK